MNKTRRQSKGPFKNKNKLTSAQTSCGDVPPRDAGDEAVTSTAPNRAGFMKSVTRPPSPLAPVLPRYRNSPLESPAHMKEATGPRSLPG